MSKYGQFRAVRDISLSPIRATDVAIIEKMMDLEDGVQNRPNTIGFNNKSSTSIHNNNHTNGQYMTISKR